MAVRILRLAAAAALALCAAHAMAQTPAAEADAQQRKAEQFLASLKPQHGTVKLPNGIATLQLDPGFYYLSPADSERLLSEGWGNPPGVKTLGMVLPESVSPLAQGGWGVVISYNEDGHVSDDDAAKIDYGKLLHDMQQTVEERNADRKEKGYRPIHLEGWAEPPYYDAQAHKLYWAKELKFDGAQADSLNYDIRVLGRKGVLEMTAVAAMSQLAQVKQQMPKVLAFTNFDQGSRYNDFNPSTDKVAAYGLAALVAGGIAAKAGLFAKLGLMILAAKKFIAIGLAAGAAFFRKLFGRTQKNT